MLVGALQIGEVLRISSFDHAFVVVDIELLVGPTRLALIGIIIENPCFLCTINTLLGLSVVEWVAFSSSWDVLQSQIFFNHSISIFFKWHPTIFHQIWISIRLWGAGMVFGLEVVALLACQGFQEKVRFLFRASYTLFRRFVRPIFWAFLRWSFQL